MIFETSGSTGIPKRVFHVSALLRREAAFFLSILPRPARVVRFVPPHHLYGYIFSVLLPELGGIPVFDARTFYGGYRPVDFAPGDLIVATPHQWQWLFQRRVRLPNGIHGVTSTSPAPPEIFGRIPLLDVYGSTETSGVGYRYDAAAPYELLPWLQPTDEAITQTDRLRWVGPRQFYVEGRKDGAIQVSGINLFPKTLEARLREYPGVKACAIRLMRPEEGRRLKAFVVLEADRPAFEAWVAKQFEGPEELASLTYGTELPVNAQNKLSDWKIPID